MAIDYYDRIADALQTISGDTSHVDDVSPTMDYYDRIADALEVIAQNGIGSSKQAGIVYATITAEPTEVENVYTYHCDKTLAQLLAAINAGSFIIAKHGDVYSPLYGYTSTKVTFQDFTVGLTTLDLTMIDVEANDEVTITSKTVSYAQEDGSGG